MPKAAKVTFIGNPEEYKLGCEESSFLYCRDCDKKNCKMETLRNFENGKIYNAYFLEYWQGERESLHIKGEDGKIRDFVPLSDFIILEDVDGVLNKKEAVVKCISHDYDNDIVGITYGNEYKAIGYDLQGNYLVMDDSLDCYFYNPKLFTIVSDPYRILDAETSQPICFVDDFED